jgi:Na+/proline symporter
VTAPRSVLISRSSVLLSFARALLSVSGPVFLPVLSLVLEFSRAQRFGCRAGQFSCLDLVIAVKDISCPVFAANLAHEGLWPNLQLGFVLLSISPAEEHQRRGLAVSFDLFRAAPQVALLWLF